MEDWVAGGHDVDAFIDIKPANTWELFHQGRWWKDTNQVWHELATMDVRHRANLLPFLRRRARVYRQACYRDALRLFCAAPDDVYEAAFDELEQLDDAAWLESTPLVAALRRYDEQMTVVDRVRTRAHNRTYKLRRLLGLARS